MWYLFMFVGTAWISISMQFESVELARSVWNWVWMSKLDVYKPTYTMSEWLALVLHTVHTEAFSGIV